MADPTREMVPRAISRGLWVLGFVSMFMDVSTLLTLLVLPTLYSMFEKEMA